MKWRIDKLNVIKKDGTIEEYNEQKIINACNKAARRAMVELSDDDYKAICEAVYDRLTENDMEDTDIYDMHNIVEAVLEELYPVVAKMYKEYRNYKKDFVHMMDKVYEKSQSIRYIGDKSNANTDSALVATKRSLIYSELNKELYKKFFLTVDERQATKDGYIYIHDMSSRLDSFNCDLCKVGEIMSGGFEMGNLWYNEPKTLDTAFDVIGDIILNTAANQYGGFTVPEIDKILAPYAEKSYCSGFVQYVYRQLGFDLTRTTYTQVGEGSEVEKSNLRQGDLVFFKKNGDVHHVGIYIENNQFIHAPQTGEVVKISNLSDRNDYYTARRIVNDQGELYGSQRK